jgi:hypothetical protein
MKSPEIKASLASKSDLARVAFLLTSYVIYMTSFSTPSEPEMTEELRTSWWDWRGSLDPEYGVGRPYGYWKPWGIIGYMRYGIWIGTEAGGAMLGAGVSVEFGFDEFVEFWGLSRKGFVWFCLAGIRVLTRISGGISKLAVSSLIAILHILICIGRTFKCIRSRI